jgi:hypothetical protein
MAQLTAVISGMGTAIAKWHPVSDGRTGYINSQGLLLA